MRVRRTLKPHHLLRRTARAHADEVKWQQRQAKAGDAVAAMQLRELGVRLDDRVEPERAGRIRARWIVTAGPKAQ